jgi:hypothetical protein
MRQPAARLAGHPWYSTVLVYPQLDVNSSIACTRRENFRVLKIQIVKHSGLWNRVVWKVVPSGYATV